MYQRLIVSTHTPICGHIPQRPAIYIPSPKPPSRAENTRGKGAELIRIQRKFVNNNKQQTALIDTAINIGAHASINQTNTRSSSSIINSGHTLIELITAITIASILSTLVFFSYNGLSRSFAKITHKAETIHEAVAIKSSLDKAFNSVNNIKGTWSEKHISFTGADGNIVHTISFTDSTVKLDGNVLASNVSRFKIEVKERQSQADGNGLVLWEAVYKGVWVGGAGEITNYKL